MADQRKSTPLGQRGAPLLLAGALGVALLAGCGGGGGNGNNGGFGNSGTADSGTNSGVNSGTNTGTNSGTNTGTTGTASVMGKVVDVKGNGVPGANINVDSGGVIATSLGQGGYRIDGLPGGTVHQITAAVTRQDNVVYTGSTQVLTSNGNVASNANIIVSPQGQQATVGGTVTDPNGNPVSGVEVFLADANLSGANNVSSLVAFTDSNGRYTIANVPTTLASGQVNVTASLAGASNQTGTVSGLQAGGSYVQNFQLQVSTQTRLAPPAIQDVFASTEPTDSISGRAVTAHAASTGVGSVYAALRRRLSPAYARLAGRHVGVSRRRVAHAIGGNYAIQTDVLFDTPSQTTGSVLNYNVYLTTGTTVPQEATSEIRDQLFDPQANLYTDLSFAGESGTGPFVPYAPQGQYNFALSAVNTDNQETTLSLPFSIVPLGPLTLTQPTVGQELTAAPTIAWNAVANVARYYVFIYDQYPTAEVNAVYSSQAIPSTTTTYTLPGALSGPATYYVVVAGLNDQAEGTDTSGQAVTVTGAAAAFSQITRFNVP